MGAEILKNVFHIIMFSTSVINIAMLNIGLLNTFMFSIAMFNIGLLNKGGGAPPCIQHRDAKHSDVKHKCV